MEWHGLQFEVKNIPPLDKNFWPMAAILRAHQRSARSHGGREIAIGLEKPDAHHSAYRMLIHDRPEFQDCDQTIVERVVKFLLWMKGGSRIIIYGDERIGDSLKVAYLPFGLRGFDAEFMTRVYDVKFTVRNRPLSEMPTDKTRAGRIGGHTEGCRIGLHIGASDRDAACVVDGRVTYAREVLWDPVEAGDLQYHYNGILESMREAAAELPQVDAIGVSAPGIYINNQCRASLLFAGVARENFAAGGPDIFIRAATEIGAPLVVENDGDVAALAGAMSIGENNVLGISMGTSEAAGFVDASGHLNGWLNELAAAPVDLSPFCPTDKRSGGKGVGSLYFSQEGVVRLAERAGITFPADARPSAKLEKVQELMTKKDPAARKVFESLGMYWGHTLALYYHFYGMENVLMLGRALSGRGGETIQATAKRVLEEEYPEAADVLKLYLPDERARRIGQSVAAASL